MRRSSPTRASQVQGKASDMLVPFYYIEEDAESGRAIQSNSLPDPRMSESLSLGNGGYVTMAHSMSDDATY